MIAFLLVAIAVVLGAIAVIVFFIAVIGLAIVEKLEEWRNYVQDRTEI